MPTPKRNIEIIRGDNFELDVALSEGYDEVLANSDVFLARLCIRLEQDDSLPILLAMEAPAELVLGAEEVPPTNCDMAYFTFKADPTTTAALPPYDLVYFVELTGPDTQMRLFQGKVKITD